MFKNSNNFLFIKKFPNIPERTETRPIVNLNDLAGFYCTAISFIVPIISASETLNTAFAHRNCFRFRMR